jgi:hypothetical protein
MRRSPLRRLERWPASRFLPRLVSRRAHGETARDYGQSGGILLLLIDVENDCPRRGDRSRGRQSPPNRAARQQQLRRLDEASRVAPGSGLRGLTCVGSAQVPSPCYAATTTPRRRPRPLRGARDKTEARRARVCGLRASRCVANARHCRVRRGHHSPLRPSLSKLSFRW